MTARQELVFQTPWLNAAGFSGFLPANNWPIEEPQGIFFTNPISFHSSSPASDRELISFPGGLLIHTGNPNPGLRIVLQRYAPLWRQSKIAICIHLSVNNLDETGKMIRMIEESECVSTIELGFPGQLPPADMIPFIKMASGELPLIVQLPVGFTDLAVVEGMAKAGADAISLGAPRGVLPGKNSQMVCGRLYGPAIFPQMLQTVFRLKECGLPVIAGGGIFRKSDLQLALSAGAAAVQLDAVLWKPGGLG
jgi:dihydroorotate dehydrogenase (NAD+) catalytic subunit